MSSLLSAASAVGTVQDAFSAVQGTLGNLRSLLPGADDTADPHPEIDFDALERGELPRPAEGDLEAGEGTRRRRCCPGHSITNDISISIMTITTITGVAFLAIAYFSNDLDFLVVGAACTVIGGIGLYNAIRLRTLLPLNEVNRELRATNERLVAQTERLAQIGRDYRQQLVALRTSVTQITTQIADLERNVTGLHTGVDRLDEENAELAATNESLKKISSSMEFTAGDLLKSTDALRLVKEEMERIKAENIILLRQRGDLQTKLEDTVNQAERLLRERTSETEGIMTVLEELRTMISSSVSSLSEILAKGGTTLPPPSRRAVDDLALHRTTGPSSSPSSRAVDALVLHGTGPSSPPGSTSNSLVPPTRRTSTARWDMLRRRYGPSESRFQEVNERLASLREEQQRKQEVALQQMLRLREEVRETIRQTSPATRAPLPSADSDGSSV